MGSASINTTHFLFSSWQSVDDVDQLQKLFKSRLAALPSSLAEKWKGILHFTNGTVTDTLGEELISTLAQWKSPRNMIEGAHVNASRLDCKYTFCPWPSQDGQFTLFAAALTARASTVSSPCPTLDNVTSPGSYLFLQLPPASSKSTCTPEAAAASAIKAGAKGVVLASSFKDDGSIPPIGNRVPASNQGFNVPVTLVSSTSGANIAKALKSAGSAGLDLSFSTLGGVGQLVGVDGEGRLAEVGWNKFADFRMLGWQAQWFEKQCEIQETLSKRSDLVVPVFNAVMTGTTTSVLFPPKSLLKQFSTIELEFTLSCPAGNMDESCSVWDRIVSVSTSCEIASSSSSSGSGGSGGSGGSVSGGRSHTKTFEVGRWINAFQRSGRWLTRTPILGTELGGGSCNFTFNVGLNNPWRATLNIRYSDFLPDVAATTTTITTTTSSSIAADVSPPPMSNLPIVYVNPSEIFSSSSYNINKTFAFMIPSGTKRVEIASLITGHSGCEFVSTSHSFVVNGHEKNQHSTNDATYYDRYMQAGTAFGCANKIVKGATPNEHGTWYFGRNGWCNGMDVAPLRWDITKDIDWSESGLAKTQHLQYKALAFPNGASSNGTDAGCAGNIRQSSFLVFY